MMNWMWSLWALSVPRPNSYSVELGGADTSGQPKFGVWGQGISRMWNLGQGYPACGTWGRDIPHVEPGAGISRMWNLGAGISRMWNLGAGSLELWSLGALPSRYIATTSSTRPHVEAGGGMYWRLGARLVVIHWSAGAHTNI
jgi:hypothetical protein